LSPYNRILIVLYTTIVLSLILDGVTVSQGANGFENGKMGIVETPEWLPYKG